MRVWLFRAKSFYNIIGLQFGSFYFYYRSVVAAKRKVICSKLQTTIFSRTAICFNIIQSCRTCWHVNAKMPLLPQPIWFPAHYCDSFMWFGLSLSACVCILLSARSSSQGWFCVGQSTLKRQVAVVYCCIWDTFISIICTYKQTCTITSPLCALLVCLCSQGCHNSRRAHL